MKTGRSPRVAIIGTFDVENYGDHLFARIAARELGRRLPGLQLDVFGPFGSAQPTHFGEDGPRVLGLADRSDSALDAFAARYDAVLIGGGELLHLNDPLLARFYGVEPSVVESVRPSAWFLEGAGSRRAASCPVLWNAIGVPFDFDVDQAAWVRAAVEGRRRLVVRDPLSKERLQAAGVAAEVEVVPDTALVVDRLFSPAELDRRRARLQAAGAISSLPTVVVQGCDLLAPWATEVARAVESICDTHDLEPVVVETGPCRGDGLFADALTAAISRPVQRLPADGASVGDLAAVLAGAELFVGSSLHGAITALAFGRPFVLVNLARESKLRGFGLVTGLEDRVVTDAGAIERTAARALNRPVPTSMLASLRSEIDDHFEEMAAAIARSHSSRRSGLLSRLRP